MSNSPHPTSSSEEILDESELAARLKTSVASIRWMRRIGRISFIKIAGNRKVRFRWPQVLEDLSASEIRSACQDDERDRQLADIASTGDEDNAEVSRDELERQSFDHRKIRLPFQGKLSGSLLSRIPTGSYIISLVCNQDGSAVFTGQVVSSSERPQLWADIRKAGANQRNCMVTMDASAAEVMARPFPTDSYERARDFDLRCALLSGRPAPTSDKS